MSGGRSTALSRAAVISAAVVVFTVLQLGVWMMEAAAFLFFDYNGWSWRRRDLVTMGMIPGLRATKTRSSLAATRFNGSKSIFVCDGALLDLGMASVLIFFRRCHGGGGGCLWTMFRRGTSFCKGGIVVSHLVEFFVQSCLTSICVSYGEQFV